MFEYIGDAIKIFFEKHLIPTVISIVISILLLLVLPENNWMILKVGKNLFLMLVAGITFLLVKFVVFMFNSVLNTINKISLQKDAKRKKEERMHKNTEEWLSFVDALPQKERELIIDFIKSDNEAIEKHAAHTIYYGLHTIYQKCVAKTELRNGNVLIKLDEEFYQIMKAIYKKRGSISHF